jgi:hypothetical protein
MMIRLDELQLMDMIIQNLRAFQKDPKCGE